MNEYDISIIIPAYNCESFIGQTIRSVLIQPSFSNIELLVIDDGSTDNTELVCNNYSQLENFSYCKIQNGGTGHARNIGIGLARGDWIIFLDHDDLIVYNSLNKILLDELKHFLKMNVDVVCCPYYNTDYYLKEKPIINDTTDDDNKVLLLRCFWANIFRKKFLIDNNCTFSEYRQFDIETAFRNVVNREKKNIVIKHNVIFYIHRDNAFSTMNTANYEMVYGAKALAYIDLFKRYNDFEFYSYSFSLLLSYSKKCLKEKCYEDQCLHNLIRTKSKQLYKNKYWKKLMSDRKIRKWINRITICKALIFLKQKKVLANKEKISIEYLPFSAIEARYKKIQ